MSGPGFIFWGLFAVFLGLVAAYLLWMQRADRRDVDASQKAADDRHELPE